MVAKILLTEMDGTPKQICFADHDNDFAPSASNDLRIADANTTDVQMTFASIADAAARHSDQGDLEANRARSYAVRCALEFATGVAAGDVTEFYWAPSSASEAGNGNPGGVSGSDAAYTGASSNLADSLFHLQLIGSVRASATFTPSIQVSEVGVFSPTERYGSLVIVAGDGLHTDDVEMHVVFDPIVDESQ